MDPADADNRLADAFGVGLHRTAVFHAQVTGRDSSLNAPVRGEQDVDRLALLVDPRSLDPFASLKGLETAALRRVLVDALGTAACA